MTPRCTHPPEGRAAEAAAAHRAALPRLETARLILRAPEIADLPAWTEILGDWPFETSPEAAWEEFSYYTAGWLLHGHGLWTVTRRMDGTVLGFVLLGLEWTDLEPELGWMFLPDYRGEGYALEAATAARDHGLALLGRGGFVSYIDPSNRPSNRLADRLGARRDPVAEGALPDGGHVWRHGGAA